jgi:hypothetical protein
MPSFLFDPCRIKKNMLFFLELLLYKLHSTLFRFFKYSYFAIAYRNASKSSCEVLFVGVRFEPAFLTCCSVIFSVPIVKSNENNLFCVNIVISFFSIFTIFVFLYVVKTETLIIFTIPNSMTLKYHIYNNSENKSVYK